VISLVVKVRRAAGRIQLFLLLGLAFMLVPGMASALDFRTVAVSKAVLYDAPSAQGKKLYVIGQGYPLEVIVNLGEWTKVRDNQGGLNWIETKNLGNTRTLLVTQNAAELRQSADTNASLVAKLDKDVVLDLVETAKGGWVKVKHRDGLSGYVLSTAVWGL